MKRYLEKILYYSFCLILFSLIFLFFCHSIISLFFKFQIPLIEKFDIYSLLSGIIGSILSCFFVFIGFKINDKSKKIDNQLVLRNMFSEELRWEVHRTLETGDVSYWYKCSGEKLSDKLISKNHCKKNFENEVWKSSKAFKNFFIPALNDYMGLFEIAYKMIKKGQISKKNFYMSYYYRLENLIDVKYIRDKLNYEEQYWVNFNKLIKMINKFKKEE